jgi:hypothetical protein
LYHTQLIEEQKAVAELVEWAKDEDGMDASQKLIVCKEMYAL